MLEIKGDIIEVLSEFDAVCVTTNGIINSKGRAVMGAGVALKFRETVQDIDLVLAKSLKANGNICTVLQTYNGAEVVAFPTKNHWSEISSTSLIIKSCEELVELADKNGWKKVCLPKPGCSNGGLKWSTIRELISEFLDDRFYVIDL